MTRPDAAYLRARAARLEQAADVHAQAAGVLAGRAAFRRSRGEAAGAAELDALLRQEERREAGALAKAAALRLRAVRLEHRHAQATALAALLPRPRPDADEAPRSQSLVHGFAVAFPPCAISA